MNTITSHVSRKEPLTRTSPVRRRFPVGAEVQSGGGAHFRVWAPSQKTISVHLGKSEKMFEQSEWVVPMQSEDCGYFSCFVAEAVPGTLYKFRLDAGEFPDPASRFQPSGPHGASEVIDPTTFRWTDHNWKGVTRENQVIYELHIGTFTSEGTFQSALRQLDELARLGITIIEVMPLADFPGRWGWGYDGVNMFAPTRLYGRPDEVKAFVDRAHALGLGVILDVVYNHFGPDGNFLRHFTPHYFSTRYKNEWGDPINFDADHCQGVRDFFVANGQYWIDEFHFDGLRLDATQQIFDASDENILRVLSASAREAAQGRGIYIVSENESQHTRLVRAPQDGGHGMDALWNDDFHHSAKVACTGKSEAYYTDYKGTAQELISALKWGYLYQGQWFKWQKKRRGTPALDLEPSSFVNYIQNHDQIANSLRGKRLHQLTSPGRFRAITALLMLGPGTPMLFQGEEFAASAPFYYFADHNPELAKLVSQGRKEFVKQFPSAACSECESLLIDPEAPETFLKSKLDLSEREKNPETYALHRDLIRLRRHDPVFSRPRRGRMEGAVLGPEAFVLRFFGGDDPTDAFRDPSLQRLVLTNLGIDLCLNPSPEPLLASPDGCRWKLVWSSEDPCYGGSGTPPLEGEDNWQIPGHATVVLIPEADHAIPGPQHSA
jgi:maltooligosyltrehalose trehalohydrolase